MKRLLVLAAIVGVGVAALLLSEHQKVATPVGPQAILGWIADAERQATRLPAAATRLSDAQEIEIGDELAENYAAYFGRIRAPKDKNAAVIAAYVSAVGERLAAHAHRKLPYRFHYIPDPGFVNAFALPGGHVFIGEGLIALMDTEDELAAVLGHEVEHIDHYHCAERYQLEARLRLVPFGGLVMLPVEVFEAGYSKDQELEADREGTRLAVWAGYSPLGALRMFETFDRLSHERMTPAKTPQQEVSRAAFETLEGYFQSHPPTQERIAQIRRLIEDERWGNLTSERKLKVWPLLHPPRTAFRRPTPPRRRGTP